MDTSGRLVPGFRFRWVFMCLSLGVTKIQAYLILHALVPGGNHGSWVCHILQIKHWMWSHMSWQQLGWTRCRWRSKDIHGIAGPSVRAPRRWLLRAAMFIITSTVASWAACGSRRYCQPPTIRGAIYDIIFREHLFILCFAPLETEWKKTFSLPRGWCFWLWKVFLRGRQNYSILKLCERSRLAIVELAYPFPAICKKNITQQNGSLIRCWKPIQMLIRTCNDLTLNRGEQSPSCSHGTNRQN